MSFLLPFLLTLLAGLSTLVGTFIYLLFRKISSNSLNFFLGMSAGVMIYLSFMELMPYSIKSIGYLDSNVMFFTGLICMGIIDYFFPHKLITRNMCFEDKNMKHLYATGYMIAVGLALHNFPEGVAVFMGSYSNLSFGILLALAITLHNIPEGIAIAAPIYHATKSKSRAVIYSLIAGLVEPVGGVFAYFILLPFLSQSIISYVFAIVAGVMVYISFDELLPICLKSETKLIPIFGITLGMMVTALSLIGLNP